MDIDQIIAAMTPDIYEKFRQAVAIRKWPDGRVLSPEQLQTCMQAIIAYESRHVPEGGRTGEVPPKNTDCDHLKPKDDESPLKWQ